MKNIEKKTQEDFLNTSLWIRGFVWDFMSFALVLVVMQIETPNGNKLGDQLGLYGRQFSLLHLSSVDVLQYLLESLWVNGVDVGLARPRLLHVLLQHGVEDHRAGKGRKEGCV